MFNFAWGLRGGVNSFIALILLWTFFSDHFLLWNWITAASVFSLSPHPNVTSLMCLPACLSLSISFSLFLHPSIHLSIHPSIHSSIHPSIHLQCHIINVSVSQSVCQSVSQSVSQSVCLSVCLSDACGSICKLWATDPACCCAPHHWWSWTLGLWICQPQIVLCVTLVLVSHTIVEK